jgi:hypothetical protein
MPTTEYSPEDKWQLICPRCNCEIKTIKSVPHAGYECIESLKHALDTIRARDAAITFALSPNFCGASDWEVTAADRRFLLSLLDAQQRRIEEARELFDHVAVVDYGTYWVMSVPNYGEWQNRRTAWLSAPDPLLEDGSAKGS